MAAIATEDMTKPPVNAMLPPVVGWQAADLGISCRFRLETANGASLRFFDQGFQYLCAADPGRAATCFRQAQVIDPSCALCFWAEALSLGPGLYSFDDPAVLRQMPLAQRSVARAMRLVKSRQTVFGMQNRDEALISALARRFNFHNDTSYRDQRDELDRRYAWSMQSIAETNPDTNVQFLAAEAWLLTPGWNYRGKGGEADALIPGENTQRALDLLRSAMPRDPNHAGMLRLYVHATLGSPYPANHSLHLASKLENTMPGASHLLHMAGDVRQRAGDYEGALGAYRRAVALQHGQVFPMHHLEAVVYCSRSLGLLADAGRAAEQLRTIASKQWSDGIWEMGCTAERYMVQPLLTFLFAGKFPAVLSIAQPPVTRLYERIIWHFARGMAHVNLGVQHLARAQAELAAVRALGFSISNALRRNPQQFGRLPVMQIADIYGFLLSSKVEGIARPQWPVSASWTRRAVQLAQKLPYDEPSPLYLGPRLFLGEVLLRAGDSFGAKAAFDTEALAGSPFVPFALFGTAEACEAAAGRAGFTGSQKCASDARSKFAKLWVGADSVLNMPTQARPQQLDSPHAFWAHASSIFAALPDMPFVGGLPAIACTVVLATVLSLAFAFFARVYGPRWCQSHYRYDRVASSPWESDGDEHGEDGEGNGEEFSRKTREEHAGLEDDYYDASTQHESHRLL